MDFKLGIDTEGAQIRTKIAKDQSKEIKIGAGRFPLVHKLIEFADIRRNYAEI